MGKNNRARDRAIKQYMIQHGCKRTEAIRALAGDAAVPGRWTWRDASARLGAMAWALAQAEDTLNAGDEDFQPRMSPTDVDLGELAKLYDMAGGVRLPADETQSLLGQLYTYREGTIALPSGHISPARVRLAMARDVHRVWMTEQVWALFKAAAAGKPPVEVPVRIPFQQGQLSPWWTPPGDAHALMNQLPGGAARTATEAALDGMAEALRTQEELAEWIRNLWEAHDCEDDDPYQGCPAAEQEHGANGAIEDAVIRFEAEMTAFCFAARGLLGQYAAAPPSH